MGQLNLVGTDDARRQLLRAHPTLHGIDYVEVDTTPGPRNQRVLQVHFIAKDDDTSLTQLLDHLTGAGDDVRVEGGVRLTGIRATSVVRVGTHLEVEVSEPGDFSTYTLVIDHAPSAGAPDAPAIDPAYSRCDFSFKVACPTRFDCRARPSQRAAEVGLSPQVDYMAKDYASFRRALLDLLPTVLPEWRERHAADLGMTLVELFAYVGDHLSYFQDAIANEAFLHTARQRVSVRRHARFVDYDMDDGASARTFVRVGVNTGTDGVVPEGTLFLGEIASALGALRPPHPYELPDHLADLALPAASTVFESVLRAPVHHRLNRIPIHTWGNRECTVPQGATFVDLTGDLAELLATDDFLLLEEVKGRTGDVEDADPRRRQVVRVTGLDVLTDPLLDSTVTRVHWHRDDALRFPLVVASWEYDEPVSEVSVARGNLVLVDHGLGHRVTHTCEHSGPRRRGYRFLLPEGPVGFSLPLPRPGGPASALTASGDGTATPRVDVHVRAEDEGPRRWAYRRHLLDSEPFDPHYTVETDDAGRACLRFGDGEFGIALPEGAEVDVSYAVGLGAVGNVGAETLVHVLRPEAATASWPAIGSVTNPLAAWGGREAESLEHTKLMAPAAFHARPLRAVTEEDYARLAEQHPDVSRAVAEFRWTGSWYTVFLTIDPRGTTRLPRRLAESVRTWVAGFAQAGYDLEIDPPTFVPLEIELQVCADPEHFRADVEEAVLTALGSGLCSDGTRAFFHPDRFTFGQPLYVSHLYAAVEAIAGVDSVTVTGLTRRDVPDPDPARPVTQAHLRAGRVDVGRLEVVRADSDPNFPENGSVRLEMRGGK